MKRYLLDTPIVAAVLLNRQTSSAALARTWIADEEAATSVLVYAEVVEYLKSLADARRHTASLRALLQVVYPYVPTYRILERYADVRRALRPPHGPGLIGDVDTLIAATALDRGLTLVTTDTDFQRVPDLQLRLLARR